MNLLMRFKKTEQKNNFRFSMKKDWKWNKKGAMKAGKMVWSVVRFGLIFILGYVIIYPLLETITKTFMPVSQYSDPSVIWIPKSLTLDNIKAAVIALDFWPAFGRTLVLCLGCAILQVVSCAITGYGFARFRFKLRGPLFALVILTIVVPTQLVFFPMKVQYRFFDFFGISHLIALFTGQPYTNYTINLVDTKMTFFLPSLLGVGIRSGLFIYIYRQFFRNMPKELEEAAKIDGCGPWSTFTRIMAPNARASALTVFLFSIIWHWNETMMTGSFFNKGNQPLSIAVQNANDGSMMGEMVSAGLYVASGRNWIEREATSYASVLMFILPPLILYVFTQKYFVEGVEFSGIKG